MKIFEFEKNNLRNKLLGDKIKPKSTKKGGFIGVNTIK